jgi:hypothetical protein
MFHNCTSRPQQISQGFVTQQFLQRKSSLGTGSPEQGQQLSQLVLICFCLKNMRSLAQLICFALYGTALKIKQTVFINKSVRIV